MSFGSRQPGPGSIGVCVASCLAYSVEPCVSRLPSLKRDCKRLLDSFRQSKAVLLLLSELVEQGARRGRELVVQADQGRAARAKVVGCGGEVRADEEAREHGIGPLPESPCGTKSGCLLSPFLPLPSSPRHFARPVFSATGHPSCMHILFGRLCKTLSSRMSSYIPE